MKITHLACGCTHSCVELPAVALASDRMRWGTTATMMMVWERRGRGRPCRRTRWEPELQPEPDTADAGADDYSGRPPPKKRQVFAPTQALPLKRSRRNAEKE